MLDLGGTDTILRQNHCQTKVWLETESLLKN